MIDIETTLASSPVRELLGDATDQLVRLIAQAEAEGIDATPAISFLASPSLAGADDVMAWLLRLQLRAALVPPAQDLPDNSYTAAAEVGSTVILRGNVLSRKGIDQAVQLSRSCSQIIIRLLQAAECCIEISSLFGGGGPWAERHRPKDRGQNRRIRAMIHRLNDRLAPLRLEVHRSVQALVLLNLR